MGNGAVRSEFGPARGGVARGVGITAAGGMLLAIVAGAWVSVGVFPVRLALLVVLGVPAVAYGGYLLTTWLPTYRLVIDEQGIRLRWRRRTIELPWHDIEYWWFGIPATASGRRKSGAGRLCLLAGPAARVDDPAAGARDTIWRAEWQRWVVCEPALTDERPDEIVTAMRHFAGQLEAHVVRANAPANSPLHDPYAVDSDDHTTVGPTSTYMPKMTSTALIGSLIVGFVLAVVVAMLVMRPERDVPLSELLVNSAGAGVLGVVLLTVVVVSFAQTGYLWWHWRQHRTMRVTASGVELRTRRHRATIPWHDIAHWRVGTGSRLLTFFMGVRGAPNRTVRTPVRDVVLAVPAEHVQDPTAGPLGAFWSSRHHAWLLCQVSHTNATTGEIAALLRRFSATKELTTERG